MGLTNDNGDGTYSYTLVETALDGMPRHWQFDWTVNTNFDDTSGLLLDDLTYELGLDADPGLGTDFLKFNPIDLATFGGGFPDHEIGTNVTVNGGGVKAVSLANYISLLANNNVLQQSWSRVRQDREIHSARFTSRSPLFLAAWVILRVY